MRRARRPQGAVFAGSKETRAPGSRVAGHASAPCGASFDVPYESARRVRALMGLATVSSATTKARRWSSRRPPEGFDRLGAAPDTARVTALLTTRQSVARGPLTGREVEVLRLIATGKDQPRDCRRRSRSARRPSLAMSATSSPSSTCHPGPPRPPTRTATSWSSAYIEIPTLAIRARCTFRPMRARRSWLTFRATLDCPLAMAGKEVSMRTERINTVVIGAGQAGFRLAIT